MRLQEGLFEEAGLLREREVDMKVRLAGLPEEAPAVVTVTVADVEAVVSNWTGIPVQRMTQDDRERLTRMEPALKVPCLYVFRTASAPTSRLENATIFRASCSCLLTVVGRQPDEPVKLSCPASLQRSSWAPEHDGANLIICSILWMFSEGAILQAESACCGFGAGEGDWAGGCSGGGGARHATGTFRP